MNHRPYELAGSLSAKVKGFMGLPRRPNVVMRKVRAGIKLESCPTATTRSHTDPTRQSGRSWRIFKFSRQNLTRVFIWIAFWRERERFNYVSAINVLLPSHARA